MSPTLSVEQIQHALLVPILAAGGPVVDPFVVLLDPTSANLFRNYAAPHSTRPPTSADIDALLAVFAEHGRRPRLEYVAGDDVDPLSTALAGAGFAVDQRIPLLALGSLVPPAPTPDVAVEIVAVEIAAADEQLLGAATVMGIAYGDDEPAEQSAARLRRTIERGGAVAVARHRPSSAIVGAGLYAPPADGLVEVAAVATHPDHRRRGVASNVGAALTEHAMARGFRPFLQAEGEDEARLYERIGFARCAEMVFALGPEAGDGQDRGATPSPAPGRSA